MIISLFQQRFGAEKLHQAQPCSHHKYRRYLVSGEFCMGGKYKSKGYKFALLGAFSVIHNR